ncbi:MAG: Ger(x)C family spore germination protein [Clostridiales bacterium]|nr:Ger(x)C family spore germination protein [Clostridiales bacterium]
MRRVMALLSAAALVVLPGCWSRREPKNMAIVSSILYDLNDDKTFALTTELMHPGPSAGGDQSGELPAIIVTSNGNTIAETLRNAEQTIERYLFAAHVEARFLSEKFAGSDQAFSCISDFIMRDHIATMRPIMMVIRGDEPEKIYEAELEYSTNFGSYFMEMVKTQPLATSKSVFVTHFEFVRDFYTEGKEPVLGCVEIVEDPAPSPQSAQGEGQEKEQKKTKIIFEGLAAFKQGVLAGFMNGNEARAYNILTNQFSSTYYSAASNIHGTVVQITGAKTKIKTDVSGELPVIDIAVHLTMTLVQESHGVDINDPAMISAIEQEVSEDLAAEIRGAVQKAQQEFGSDIFGFGAVIHRQHPHAWRQMREGWADLFPTADVRLTVESCLERLGEVEEPFIREGS